MSKEILKAYKDELEPKEFEFLSKLLSELQKADTKRSTYKQVRPIIPIQEWIVSQYYAGPDVVRLYPYWRNAIIEVFSSEIPINEVILTGSIGSGKSTAAIYMIVRKLYELSCYQNIPARFDLMSSSLVSFLYFSLSKSQAELTGFGQIKNLLDTIPYFRDHFARNTSINSIIMWPDENLVVTYGSDYSHAIGMNMIGSILDEANFSSGVDVYDPNRSVNTHTSKMARMYSSIINRAKSRFIVGGTDHSLSILVSSATTSSSFTEKRMVEAAGKPNVRIYNPAIWEVKPEGTYSNKHFWVFRGDEGVDPFIVSSLTDINVFREAKGLPRSSKIDIDDAIAELGLRYRIYFVAVPEDFRSSFEINIIQSLQEIAGISVSPMGKLFTSKSAYNACVDQSGFLRHPFTREQPVIATGDSIQVKDFLIPEFQFREPTKSHFIHIDQSVTTDATGMAMAHISNHIEDPDTGMRKAVIDVDFMLRIVPPAPPRQIAIYKVRDFCFHLKEQMGINIGKVSYDWFASAESMQALNEAGIESSHLSVDRTDEQYITLVNLIMEGRIRFYDYPVFRRELFDLIWYRARRKVDHPGNTATGGTKDVADAVVGAVWNALQSEEFSFSDSANSLDMFIRANLPEKSEREELLEDLMDDYLFERR